MLTEEQFQRLHHSLHVGQQRVSALRFGDRNVQALWHTLVLSDLLPTGFSNGQLRLRLAPCSVSIQNNSRPAKSLIICAVYDCTVSSNVFPTRAATA